jgi:uridine monophosphate synthetase
MKQHLVDQLKKVEIVKTGNFILKSGQASSIYFDMRSIISYPKLMADICVQLSRLVPSDRPLLITGVPMGALPYATLLSQLTKNGMIIPRAAKKEYGLQRNIEGRYTSGQEVVVVEDVVTTGGSVLDTIQILEREGLKVAKIVVVLDRMAGGMAILRNKGYDVVALLSFSDFFDLNFSSHIPLHEKSQEIIRNSTAKKLVDIIESKRTNLVVSLDLTDTRKIVTMLMLIAEHICAVKLHYDIIDTSKDICEDIRELAIRHNFLIIEDRKYGDIPFISMKQYDNIPLKADMVTVHGICGEEIVIEFEKKGVDVLLVHGMSSKDALTDYTYGAKIKEMGAKYSNVAGFVSQDLVLPGYLTFTPGVNLKTSTDGMGQVYHTLDDMDSGPRVFIVGRGIYESDNIVETVKQYRALCYQKWR